MNMDEKAERIRLALTLRRVSRFVTESQKRARMRECCELFGDNEMEFIEQDLARITTFLVVPTNESA